MVNVDHSPDYSLSGYKDAAVGADAPQGRSEDAICR